MKSECIQEDDHDNDENVLSVNILLLPLTNYCKLKEEEEISLNQF